MNERLYPTPEEQHRFIKAYIQHRSPTSSQAQNSAGHASASSASSSFILDNRASSAEIVEQERARERSIDAEIQQLMQEIRLWRIANSAQWVAWGIVQAKVEIELEAEVEKLDNDGLAMGEKQESKTANLNLSIDDTAAQGGKEGEGGGPGTGSGQKQEGEDGEGEEEEEFDYLAYAQERAYFFWGDALQLGLVSKEDLPAELLKKIKIVRY